MGFKRRMKKQQLLGVALSIGLMLPASAASFVVQDVRLNGLDRLTAGTVFSYLKVSTGQTVDDKSFPSLIRGLYQSGLFADVSLQRSGNVLIVNVKEHPVIDQVSFSGNKDIGTKQLTKVLHDIRFYEGQIFNPAQKSQIEKELIKQYENKSKFAADVVAKVTALPRNRVAVHFDISEGRTTQIQQINFVGNHVFSAKKLKKQMALSTTGYLSILTKDDRYTPELLNQDLESLRNFYKNNGYLKFEINSADATLSADKKEVALNVSLTEGDKYTITAVDITGQTIVDKQQLVDLISISLNKPYKHKDVEATVEAIKRRLGDEGYALAKVNPIPDINEADKTVRMVFAIDPVNRAYVSKINIEGNARTQDEVLRREMRQMEGSWFVSHEVDRSKKRIQRLPYIEEVEVGTEPVANTNDQVELTYKVKERSASSVQFVVGYGQDEGVIFGGSLDQANFMGTGREVKASFNTSDTNTDYSLSFNDPYFTDDGISAGFRINYTKTDLGETDAANYLTDSYGLMLNFGYPISEQSNLRWDIGYEKLKVKTAAGSPIEIVDILNETENSCIESIERPGECDTFSRAQQSYDLFRSSFGWTRDTRDRTVFATSGTLNRLLLSGTLPGSDETFYKLQLRHQTHLPITDEVSFTVRGDIAYGDGYSDTSSLPFFENFYAGGLKSVRGYRTNSLGARYKNGEAIGGAFKVNGTAELIMPVPTMVENKNLRWTAFIDGGQVYSTYDDFEADELRYSAGVSAAWISPLGPLVFSYGKPLNSKEGDREQSFQFSLGIPF